MTDYSKIIISDKHIKPSKDGMIWLIEEQANMRLQLAGVPPGSMAFRFTDENPLSKCYKIPAHSFGDLKVSLIRICDYLVLVKRSDKLYPIFIEMQKECSESIPLKKLEQLYCSHTIIEFYRPVYEALLNGKCKTEPARYILINEKRDVKFPRMMIEKPTFSNRCPRLAMQSSVHSGRIDIIYYGGRSKFIKVGSVVMNKDKKLFTNEIFKALPEPEPSKQTSEMLRQEFQRLEMR